MVRCQQISCWRSLPVVGPTMASCITAATQIRRALIVSATILARPAGGLTCGALSHGCATSVGQTPLERMAIKGIAAIALVSVAFGLLMSSCTSAHAQVLSAAQQHKRTLVRIAHSEWGLGAPWRCSPHRCIKKAPGVPMRSAT